MTWDIITTHGFDGAITMMRLFVTYLNSYETLCRYTGGKGARQLPTELQQHLADCWKLYANRENHVQEMNRNKLLKPSWPRQHVASACWQWLFAAAQPRCVFLPAGFPPPGSTGPWVRMELTSAVIPLLSPSRRGRHPNSNQTRTAWWKMDF